MKTIFFIGTLALISAFALIISWVSSANLSIWSLIGLFYLLPFLFIGLLTSMKKLLFKYLH